METNLDSELKASLVHSELSRNYKFQKEFQKLRPSAFERVYVFLFCFSLPIALGIVYSYYDLPIQAIWTLLMGIMIFSTLFFAMVQYIENIHKRIDLLEKFIKNDS